MKVYKTTNYEGFRTIKGNRKVRENHVRKLMKSIQQRDLLEQNPIIVGDKMEVVDGQHRLEAAKRLGLPIYYVRRGGVDIETVISLQTAAKWSVRDVIDMWCERGNQHYVILRDFMDKYGVSAALAKSLLSGSGQREGTSPQFWAGGFQVTRLKKASEFVEKYVQVAEIVNKPFCKTRDFILAVQEITQSPQYSHKRMLEKLEHSGHILEARESKTDYLRDLETVYNRFQRDAVTRLF